MMSSLNATSRKHGIGVKHTPTWEANLNLAGEAFAESISDSNRFQSSMATLADTKMTSGQAAKFSKRFFLDFKTPDKSKKKEEKTQRSKTRLKNKVDELVSLFEEGMGNEGKTRYDMFNAVTEYLDHHSVKKNTNNGRRFLSNLSGMQANKKRRAMRERLPMAA